MSFKITNSGKVDGAEVAQIYIKDVKASEDRPEKELKNFEKVFLKKGETKTIQMEINKNQLAFFSKLKNKWINERGNFEVQIGSSSRDIRLKAELRVH